MADEKTISGANWLDTINERRQKLLDASKELKDYFVGLDDIIDKIIKNIEVWYVLPEILTRPIIVNLWGMTGVGKTDLVRRLAKALDRSDSFVEIQLTNKGSASDTTQTTLESTLSYSNLEDGKPGILLLDEVQRFRSVDDSGAEIHDYQFQDVWTFLSDGKFSAAGDSKNRLFSMIFESLYWDDYRQSFDEEEADDVAVGEETGKEGAPAVEKKKKKRKRKFSQSYFEAQRLKKLLRLEEDISEIMSFDKSKISSMLVEKMKDQTIYEGTNFAKLLVFISGNLDEAFAMSSGCEETDIDADILHKFSLDINVIAIKKALKRRFKPEQIARLGNVHVIYPSLSKGSYEEIINRKMSEVINNVEDKTGIRVRTKESINDAIYRNGVFPVQGTRPLFSTISCILENSLPFFVLKSIEAKVSDICLYYEDKHVCADINGQVYRSEFEGDIDKIKRYTKKDIITLAAVHEAGHAVVYGALLGLAPAQIAINTASIDNFGFMWRHNFVSCKNSILDGICCALAGLAAEEMIFGVGERSVGSGQDIEEATVEAAKMTRQWGMDADVSAICPHTSTQVTNSYLLNNDFGPSSARIEVIVREAKAKAKEVLKDNVNLFHVVTNELISDSKIEAKDFTEICKAFDLNVKLVDARDRIIKGYDAAYNSFFVGEVDQVTENTDYQVVDKEEKDEETRKKEFEERFEKSRLTTRPKTYFRKGHGSADGSPSRDKRL